MRGRVDHISKKCAKQFSKLFIPFLDIRIDTKKMYSSIGDDLGVPQAAFLFRGNFVKILISFFLFPEAFLEKKYNAGHPDPDASLDTHIHTTMSVICHR